jgi:hypothetical protein
MDQEPYKFQDDKPFAVRDGYQATPAYIDVAKRVLDRLGDQVMVTRNRYNGELVFAVRESVTDEQIQPLLDISPTFMVTEFEDCPFFDGEVAYLVATGMVESVKGHVVDLEVITFR